MFPIHLIPSGLRVPFIEKRWWAFAFSLIFSVAALVSLGINKLNLGIDFTGGIVIEARFQEAPELNHIRQILSSKIGKDVAIQHMGTEQDVMIRIQGEDEIAVASPSSSASAASSAAAEQAGAVEGLSQSRLVQQVQSLISNAYHDKVEYRKVDVVGPQVSEELITGGAIALLGAVFAIMLYVWFRFEWHFGIGAVLALLHDVIMTLGFISWFGLEFNLTSIAAILTIIGYSINDSVVIYDRIRENLRKFKKKSIIEILNISINDTLSRTLLTVGTTVMALLALVFLGGAVIQGFSVIILFGVIIGTYSSVYISAPVLIYFKLREF